MKPSLFLFLTYGWSWLLAAIVYVLALPVNYATMPFVVFAAAVGPAMFAWAGGILPPLGPVFRFTNLFAWVLPLIVAWGAIGLCDQMNLGRIDLTGAGLVERVLIEGGDPNAAREQLAAMGGQPPLVASVRAFVLSLLVYFPLALFEEVVWRGVVFGWLRTPSPMFGRWASAGLWAFWVTPMLAVSGQLWELAAYFPLGVVLVGLRERTGGVLAPALARGGFWAVIGIDALALGLADERLSSPFGVFSFGILSVLAVTAGRWNHARTLGLGYSPTMAED